MIEALAVNLGVELSIALDINHFRGLDFYSCHLEQRMIAAAKNNLSLRDFDLNSIEALEAQLQTLENNFVAH